MPLPIPDGTAPNDNPNGLFGQAATDQREWDAMKARQAGAQGMQGQGQVRTAEINQMLQALQGGQQTQTGPGATPPQLMPGEKFTGQLTPEDIARMKDASSGLTPEQLQGMMNQMGPPPYAPRPQQAPESPTNPYILDPRTGTMVPKSSLDGRLMGPGVPPT